MLSALAISLILGPYVIRKLTAYKIGQSVRDDGPKSHLTKAGTPTMGGALPVLVKGSRSMRMERFCDAIAPAPQGGAYAA